MHATRPFPSLPGLALFLTLAAFTLPGTLAGSDFDFTRATSALGWEPAHHTGPLTHSPDGLALPITGPDPFITSPTLPDDPGPEPFIELRIRSSTAGFAQLFWYRNHPREADSTHFEVPANRWTDVCLPLPISGTGWRLRLDPPGTNGTAQVAWIRVRPESSIPLRQVEARGREIEIHIQGQPGPVELHELAPHQSASDAGDDTVLHRAEFGGNLRIRVPRFTGPADAPRDRLTSGFVLARPAAHQARRPDGPVRLVDTFDATAALATPPVVARGKKGLQVQMVDDALALGIHHAALNVNLPGLAARPGAANPYVHVSNGRRFLFDRGAVDAIPVKPLSDHGVSVSLILLAYASGDPAIDRTWLHPGYRKDAPNHLGAFNTSTPDGAAHFAAAVEFLAAHFSRPDARAGRVSHFIVGNEVTAHWHWANMGEVPAGVFIADYARCVRLAHAATRKVTDAIRVTVSFDHHWNLTYGEQPLRAIPGRRLLDEFNRLGRLGGNFDWHMAYHPYPENLFNPRAWADKTALPTPDSPRITFRNLDVLTTYLARPECLLRGQPRRILLSEQGFHSDGTAEGERLQAAAYAYAWHKVEALPGIDAFILHRHVDHRDEGGLNLGLWRRRPDSVATPLSKKTIYDVFQAAGTPRQAEAFRFALPVVGIQDWKDAR